MDNLAKVKKVSKEWVKSFRARQHTELQEMEEGIKKMYKENVVEDFFEAEHKKLKDIKITSYYPSGQRRTTLEA